MAYAATQSQNCGPMGGSVANFGSAVVESSGTANLGALKVAGLTQLGGAQTTYTQTYSTASSTVSNATYSAASVTTVATSVTKTNSSPYGFSSGDADKVVTFCGAVPTDLAAINTALIALAADVLQLKKGVTQIIDDLQLQGLAL